MSKDSHTLTDEVIIAVMNSGDPHSTAHYIAANALVAAARSINATREDTEGWAEELDEELDLWHDDNDEEDDE